MTRIGDEMERAYERQRPESRQANAAEPSEYDRGFAECQQRVIALLKHDIGEAQDATALSLLSDTLRAASCLRPHDGMDYANGEGTVEQMCPERTGNGSERTALHDDLQPLARELHDGDVAEAVWGLLTVVDELLRDNGEAKKALHNFDQRLVQTIESAKALGFAAAKAGKGHP